MYHSRYRNGLDASIAAKGLKIDHLPEEPDYRNLAAAIVYLFLDILQSEKLTVWHVGRGSIGVC